MANLTLVVVALELAVVLAMLDKDAKDSRELVLRKEVFKAAPEGLCTTHIDGLLLEGERDTLCKGANRPYLGRHSKYLIKNGYSGLFILLIIFFFSLFCCV